MEAREILEKYKTETYPPVLNEVQQIAVKEFFTDNNMELNFGAIPFNGQAPVRTSILMIHESATPEMLDSEDSIPGPVFYGEELETYYPDGVGIWTRKYERVGKKNP